MPDSLLPGRFARTAIRLAASTWLLVCLIFSVALAYDAPRWVLVPLLMLDPYRWIVLGLWGVVPALLVFKAGRSIFRGHYLIGIRWIATIVFGFVVVWPDALIGPRLRFYASKYAYDRVTADVEAGFCEGRKWPIPVEFVECRKPVVVTFDWFGLGSAWSGVVYDAADEMRKPVKDRSAAWKTRDVGRILSCSEVAVSLGWHYYLTGGDISGDCG